MGEQDCSGDQAIPLVSPARGVAAFDDEDEVYDMEELCFGTAKK